jgi:histidinol-phosphate aminotransferase
VVFVASPNNPTGTIVGKAEWREFLSSVPEHVVVVVDQAYVEYVDDADHADALEDLGKHPGLMVLRTFSKIYGLAGLRVGYGVGPPDLIEGLARLRQPFNVNSLAQAAALAALDDDEHVQRSRALVARGRAHYERALTEIGCAYVPTQANFVLVDVGDGDHIAQAMLEQGVIVRPMGAYGLPAMLRITFGNVEENERCLAVLRTLVAERRP